MSRLLVFLAFLVTSPVVLVIRSVEAMGTFLGAFVINYGLGKVGDIFIKEKSDVVDSSKE